MAEFKKGTIARFDFDKTKTNKILVLAKDPDGFKFWTCYHKNDNVYFIYILDEVEEDFYNSPPGFIYDTWYNILCYMKSKHTGKVSAKHLAVEEKYLKEIK